MAKPIVVNLLTLALLFLSVAAAPDEDLVHFPVAGYVDHKWYSGYLNFSTGHFHYVFFDSQRDPDNDPVVLWLNGGPGCSSMIGMVLEHGPFILYKNKTNFYLNDYSWNKKANVLYLESPGGVGFSKGFRNDSNDDATVAEDNYRALIDFFRKFPNLKKNDFYISGESYAGVYVPYLAKKILDMNKLPSSETKISLKGFLIGNACTNPRECYEPDSEDSMSIYQYQFLYNHNYIVDKDYTMITGSCTLGYSSKGCRDIRKKVDAKFDQTLTVINNIYQACTHQNIPYLPRELQGRRNFRSFTTCEDLLGIYHFFNEPTIFSILHVDPVKWDICSESVQTKYVQFPNASQYLYPELINAGLKIWVYSGDIDANVPIVGTLRWLTLMKDVQGIPVLEPWREWWVPGLHKHEDQMAGMVWKLRGLTFVSVKGAGHMVPADKPKEAQVMLQAFLSGNDLPYKTP